MTSNTGSPGGIAIKLAVCALICMSVLGLIHLATVDAIAKAQIRKQTRQLKELLAESDYDNSPNTDTISVTSDLLGDSKPHTVWRARAQGSPAAIVMDISAPYGYNGPIKLLIGISIDGVVTGVRVTEHRETPGLGDAIDLARSDWIKGFDGNSLNTRPAEKWQVKKQGGEFDQFTGATITPSAIVKAVHDALLFYNQNRDTLFE